MLFAFGILTLAVVALAVGGLIAGAAPLFVLLIAFVLLLIGAAVMVLMERRRLPVERERESITFEDEDYETLARRPEHTHGDVKRGPTRPPGATP